MTTKVYNENDKLIEIQENGETVWRDDNYVQRPKISGKSREELINAIENNDGDTFRKKVFEILTGETLEEAQK